MSIVSNDPKIAVSKFLVLLSQTVVCMVVDISYSLSTQNVYMYGNITLYPINIFYKEQSLTCKA